MKLIKELIESAINALRANDKLPPEERGQAIDVYWDLLTHVEDLTELEPGDPRRLDEADLELIHHDFVVIRAMLRTRSLRVRDAVVALLCVSGMDDTITSLTDQLELPLDDTPPNLIDLCNRANGGVAPSPGGPPGRVRMNEGVPPEWFVKAHAEACEKDKQRAMDDGVDYEALQS